MRRSVLACRAVAIHGQEAEAEERSAELCDCLGGAFGPELRVCGDKEAPREPGKVQKCQGFAFRGPQLRVRKERELDFLLQ